MAVQGTYNSVSFEYKYEKTTASYSTTTTAKDKAAETDGKEETLVGLPADDVTITGANEEPEAAKTYTPDMKKVKALKMQQRNDMDAFVQMIQKLFEKQGKTASAALNGLREAMENGKLGEFMSNLEVDEETRAQAEADIADGGKWSVDKTAERIMDFAKAISGGDPSKIGELRDAVKKGFDEAEKAWGGELPEISKKTYDKVMEMFDKWENGEE